MRNPFARKPKPYVAERTRLLEYIQTLTPTSDEYHTVLQRINELDKILNRTSEKFKTVAGVAGPSVAIAAVYALQQFGGILVPKALETYASRSDAKKSSKELD